MAAGVLAEYTQINENDAELAETKVRMMIIMMREIIIDDDHNTQCKHYELAETKVTMLLIMMIVIKIDILVHGVLYPHLPEVISKNIKLVFGILRY